MKRILFVDDDPNVLEGMERMLFPLRKEWHMVFARSGSEALQRMDEEPFDIVVSDMRMPEMDGATLLTEVMKRHPQVVRFVLTGQSDKETVFRSVGAAHQLLAKPCSPKELKSCVNRAFVLRDLFNNDALKRIVSQIGTLPALPQTYARLMSQLQSPDAAVASIGKTIESDLAMTAKVLQLVNSAFFGLRQQVSSATQAVTFLGLETIKALVLMTGVFAYARTTGLTALFSLDALWRHSMLVGLCAQAISKQADAGQDEVKDAFTAGVLHDAGVLILVDSCTEAYKTVLEAAAAKRLPLAQVEQAGFGCTHAAVGAYLLGIWGLPDSIVEAVAFHHDPGQCGAHGLTPLTAVHTADAFVHEFQHPGDGAQGQMLNQAYVESLGLQDRVQTWRETCQALLQGQERTP